MFEEVAFEDRAFQRKVLQAYLAVIIVILTIVTYIILAGVGFQVNAEFVVVSILIIILISINILHTIIGLRILDHLDDGG